MSHHHQSGIATALVLLALLAILFWNKLSAMVTTSLGGIPVPDSTKTLNVANMVQVPLIPDNVPVVKPYVPGPPPNIIDYGTGHIGGVEILQTVSHPFTTSPVFQWRKGI